MKLLLVLALAVTEAGAFMGAIRTSKVHSSRVRMQQSFGATVTSQSHLAHTLSQRRPDHRKQPSLTDASSASGAR